MESDLIKLRHNGHAQEYWNGSKWIEFGPDGTYRATKEEADVLLGCFGVSIDDAPPKNQVLGGPGAPIEHVAMTPEFAAVLTLLPDDILAKLQGYTTLDDIPFLGELAQAENEHNQRDEIVVAILNRIQEIRKEAEARKPEPLVLNDATVDSPGDPTGGRQAIVDEINEAGLDQLTDLQERIDGIADVELLKMLAEQAHLPAVQELVKERLELLEVEPA